MVSVHERFAPFASRMRAEGLPDAVVRTFEHYYTQLVGGSTGLIPEREIRPVASLPDAEALGPEDEAAGREALGRAVILKLNGGLGTSMGLDRAKSLLTVKDGLSFLDVVAHQARHQKIPLVLMNSFATHDDSLAVLANYPDLESEIPLAFVQHKVPKVVQSDLSPVDWPKDPQLEWCPPGHGNLYTAVVTSGMLGTLLEAGYEYAFVSNVDNLGAVMDPAILGYFVRHRLPFLMEVADRTAADKKGGHLAEREDGQLILRESAQCPPEERKMFQDVQRHRYFNTNNLWLDLRALAAVMKANGNVLTLPMIRNAKKVDPRDSTSTPVYQLETAMGAAIEMFEGAAAIRVPRLRFAPVKTTEDLLRVRSDRYTLAEDYRIVPRHKRTGQPIVIQLDRSHYGRIDDLDARFPHGAPSLIDCQRLEIQGDVRFGQDVTIRGEVRLVQEGGEPMRIADGADLSG